jgi:hypothetical protein
MEHPLTTQAMAGSLAEDHRRIVSGLAMMRKAIPLETVDARDLDPKAFRRFVDTNRPCLIKGAAAHWPALRRWTRPGYLVERTEGQTVNIYPHVNYVSEERHLVGQERVSFATAWERLHDPGTASAAAAWPISNAPIFPTPDHVYENLAQDIPGFEFLPDPPEPLAFPKWRGFLYRDGGTGWHYHPTDCTLMTQVEGSKIVGLLPPDPRTFAAVYDAFMTDACFDDPSCLDGSAEVLAPLIATVEKGDSIFLPPYWWHGVEATTGFGITVPFCWRQPLHIAGSIHLPAVRRLIRFMVKNWRTKPNGAMLAATGAGALIAAARAVARTAGRAGR